MLSTHICIFSHFRTCYLFAFSVILEHVIYLHFQQFSTMLSICIFEHVIYTYLHFQSFSNMLSICIFSHFKTCNLFAYLVMFEHVIFLHFQSFSNMFFFGEFLVIFETCYLFHNLHFQSLLNILSLNMILFIPDSLYPLHIDVS